MGAVAALAAALTWAFGSLLFERFGRSAGGLALNLIKCSIALALFLPTLFLVSGTFWPTGFTPHEAQVLALSGFVGLTIGDTFWFFCLLRIGARRSLLLFTLSPAMTAMMGALILKEPVTLMMGVGMSVTLAGVAWVVGEPDETGAPQKLDRLGVAFGLFSSLCQAIGSVLTKLVGEGHPSLDVSVVRLAAGTAGLLLVCVLTGRIRRVALAFEDRRNGMAVVLATFLGTYLGVWFMNAGFLLTSVGLAATLNSMSPIFVLPLAAIFMNERPSRRALVGASIAVAGVALLFVTVS